MQLDCSRVCFSSFNSKFSFLDVLCGFPVGCVKSTGNPWEWSPGEQDLAQNAWITVLPESPVPFSSVSRGHSQGHQVRGNLS